MPMMTTLMYEMFANNDPRILKQYLVQNNVQQLDLHAQGIGSNDLSLVAKAVEGTQVTTLNLEANRIQSDALNRLLIALKGTNVERLILTNNVLDPVCLNSLAVHLPQTTIKSINLAGCSINGNELIKFANTYTGKKLKHIDLTANSITGENALEFVKVMKSKGIARINFNRNKIDINSAKAITKHLVDRPELSINMNANGIDNTKLANLMQELKEARHQFKQNAILSPYYLLAMHAAHDSEFSLTARHPSEDKNVDPFAFAGEIFANLPLELALKIASFMPYMDSTFPSESKQSTVGRYQALLNQRAVPPSLLPVELDTAVVDTPALVEQFNHLKLTNPDTIQTAQKQPEHPTRKNKGNKIKSTLKKIFT